MNLKSIFCNHNYEFLKFNLPDGQERTKKRCVNCEKIKIYCSHAYEIIAKTYKEGGDPTGFSGSIYAFNQIKDFMVDSTEILFKCKNCGNLHKETLEGKEIV